MNTRKNILAGVGTLLLLVAALVAPRPEAAHAADQSGEKNLVVWKSTYTQTAETSSTTAKAGGVLGIINISSAVIGGTFIVYDSSDAVTSGKEKLADVGCGVAQSYVYHVAADLGLSYVSAGGCRVTMTFLDHR